MPMHRCRNGFWIWRGGGGKTSAQLRLEMCLGGKEKGQNYPVPTTRPID